MKNIFQYPACFEKSAIFLKIAAKIRK